MKQITTKRAFAALAIAATVALPAVGNSPAIAAPTSGKVTAVKGDIHLGIAYWETRTYAFQLMYKGAEAAAAQDKRIDLKGAAPDAGDPSKLVPLFQSLAATQKDGLVLQALAADPFYRPVKTVTDSGEPVIAIDAPPPANSGVNLFITNDNVQLGTDLAAELGKKIPATATGEVIIGTNGPSVPPLKARVIGMQKWFAANRPNVTVVGPLSTTGNTQSPQDNYAAWEGIYAQHPKALAYMAPSAQDAVSLGLLEQKKKVKLLVGGMDLEPSVLPYIKQGLVAAVVSPEHWLKGYIATKLLALHAEKGKSIPKGVWDTGGLVVNSKNIAAVIKRQANDAAMRAALAKVGDAQIANSSKYVH